MAIPPVSALVIGSVPYSQLVTSADFNAGTFSDGVANEVWFKYTATADQIFGFVTTDPFSGVFVPLIQILQSNGTTLINSIINTKALDAQLTNGNDYYIKITRNAISGPSDQNFTVTADVSPILTSIPDGSYVINDDAAVDLPAIVFDSTGTILGYVNVYPPGEGGASLDNGISCWYDLPNKLTTPFILVARDLSVIAQFDLTIPIGGAATEPTVRRGGLGNFYISDIKTPTHIFKVTPTGTVTQVATITGVPTTAYTIGISLDETTAYFVRTYQSNKIESWNLITDSYIGTFCDLSGILVFPWSLCNTAEGNPGDILTLSNGNVVFWFEENNTLLNTLVLTNSSGTILKTITLPANQRIDHIAYHENNPNSIILWVHDNNAETGIIGEYDLNTESYISSFSVQLFQAFDNKVGQNLFGPSASCVIVAIYSGIVPPPTVATINVEKHTIPAGSPQIFNFETDLDPTTFSLTDGQSTTYNNVAPGTYFVNEIVPSGWDVSYVVDNGDTHDAITVAAGDVVTVFVTNLEGTPPGPPINNAFSGIYKIVPGKRNDSLWQSYDPVIEKDVKIPDPFIKTGLIGE